jgi:hypothetical protein
MQKKRDEMNESRDVKRVVRLGNPHEEDVSLLLFVLLCVTGFVYRTIHMCDVGRGYPRYLSCSFLDTSISDHRFFFSLSSLVFLFLKYFPLFVLRLLW